MNEEITGRIYNIQRFTVHDGPGIRTEVFLKGCPLSCLWCHSPESQQIEKQLGWLETRCIGVDTCGKCMDTCPKGAISVNDQKDLSENSHKARVIKIDRDTCDNCGKCAEDCPSGALEMLGKDMTTEEVMKVIYKDLPYYGKSGGGVTISGGEPLIQDAFTKALLKECKDNGLHTCLDTSGFVKWEKIRKVMPYVDLFLYDLKHMDNKKSLELVGVPNELILANAKKIASEGAFLQIRIPIIPGLNDSEDNLHETSRFCVQLGEAVSLVQILPYHKLGITKYKSLDKEYALEDLSAPGDEHMENCKSLVESHGLKVRIH